MASSIIFLSFSESLPNKFVYGKRPISTISLTLSEPVGIASVNTQEISLDFSVSEILFSFLFFISILPPRASCKPTSVRIRVDFPHPFGPIRQTISPAYRLSIRFLAMYVLP